MKIVDTVLLRMFGRPYGLMGRIGGLIMARANRECAAWVLALLNIQINDIVLEVGFGPGVCIQMLADLAALGLVAGVDPAEEMVKLATARNAKAVRNGRIDLRYGSAENLPFPSQRFDKAVAINSLQVWPDVLGGLREIYRVVKAGGNVAFGFTPYSGRSRDGLIEIVKAAGFTEVRLVESDLGFSVLANKTDPAAKT